ncbi:hypothetical protein EB796_024219 [Bugula neritina]|uniref:RING-type domain-containing protein n=1 Tax=Bugula neritina TaxID=10212 RepID=A0A7J7IW68_BUGNE|nr:hypothetical protein EB796_024219 [Bugula neritina]
MASSSRKRTVKSLIADAFELTLECGICTNQRELRMLPCQHMMCAECLDQQELCETEGCSRPFDFYCSQCLTFYCFRCSKQNYKCLEGRDHKNQMFDEQLKICICIKMEGN